ncbi:pre-mRNA-splicing factor Syf2p [[Candida] jaroonii]|uniref:Pre-mRNA-splicing factor Syf2p n=1 Tax=[Candida] jaroonii TaxID=467808 RepID=A0ACA9Y2R5_9ASCO|nr:pre-mRNA-splicing factor Syf2p [[Candida] jaroonii]
MSDDKDNSHDTDSGAKASKIERLKRLKALKSKVKKSNVENLRDEALGRKLKSEELRQKLREDLQPEEKVERKSKLLSYSIEETNQWISKQKDKQSGFDNFDDLALKTYNKEISELNIDKDLHDTKKKDNQLINQQKPTEEQIDNMKSIMKLNQDKRKRKLGDSGVYINQDNRKFNEKLDKQYR